MESDDSPLIRERISGHGTAPIVRAVLDTSSLVPHALRWDLQQAAQLGAFAAFWSPWIIAELNRVLVWRWIDRYGDSRASRRECSPQAKVMMEILLSTFELVNPRPPHPPAWESLADQWDIPVWAAARVTDAQYVVSENTHDYPPADERGRHSYEGVEYISARAFLMMLTGDLL